MQNQTMYKGNNKAWSKAQPSNTASESRIRIVAVSVELEVAVSVQLEIPPTSPQTISLIYVKCMITKL